MSKYITRDKLADFVEKMWDAGMKVDLRPEDSTIAVRDANYNTEYVDVFDKQSYDNLIKSLTKREE